MAEPPPGAEPPSTAKPPPRAQAQPAARAQPLAGPQWLTLRRRLLAGGVSPRRVRRLIAELQVHYDELLAEHPAANGTEASQIALQRLGSEQALADRMLAQANLLSWSRRWPWAVYTAGALLLFAAAFAASCGLIVAIGAAWQMIRPSSPAHVLGLLRAIGISAVYGLPAASAAAMAILAVRRRVAIGWAVCAVCLLCLLGATTNVDVFLHHVRAGIGFSTRPAFLATLFLRRWLPSALGALVLTGASLCLARVAPFSARSDGDGET